ncbi:MAG TPA: pyridoxine 5'-phosphate synthase [Rhodothermales bacterium]
MTRLLINIDHVATLRNARRESVPDPVHAAAICEAAGAAGIVFHLREDRRHITDRDVRLLRQTVKTKLDFELSVNPEIVDICCEIRPHLATLVPERREEVTTEGGLDVVANRERITSTVQRLQSAGIEEVALFVDPELDQISAALDTGANCIELHTGEYANAQTAEERFAELTSLAAAAKHANTIGLQVHAGHGLDYANYPSFARHVRGVREVSIGFAVVARALLVGLDTAVRDMLRIVNGHHAPAHES